MQQRCTDGGLVLHPDVLQARMDDCSHANLVMMPLQGSLREVSYLPNMPACNNHKGYMDYRRALAKEPLSVACQTHMSD